jgi:hypothetical protein
MLISAAIPSYALEYVAELHAVNANPRLLFFGIDLVSFIDLTLVILLPRRVYIFYLSAGSFLSFGLSSWNVDLRQKYIYL